MPLEHVCVRAKLCLTLRSPMNCSLVSLSMRFQGKNTPGVGCCFLTLQGVFPTQDQQIFCVPTEDFTLPAPPGKLLEYISLFNPEKQLESAHFYK